MTYEPRLVRKYVDEIDQVFIGVYDDDTVFITIGEESTTLNVKGLRALLKPAWNITDYGSVDYAKGPMK